MNQRIRKLFFSDIFIVFLFFIISFALYANSLRNDFAVVDDLQGYIENPLIRNIPQSLKTFELQAVVYSINYSLFGLNPLPLRILAVIHHAIVATLSFFLFKQLFNKKIAFISSVLFIAHPINTEALDWISSQFYIVMAIFLYSVLLLHISYRHKEKNSFLYWMVGVFSAGVLLLRTPWIFIIPLAVIVQDYFFIQKKADFKFYKKFITLCLPILIVFFFIFLKDRLPERFAMRSERAGSTTLNQQSFTPIIEGYPYSIYHIAKLYTFPKDLTIYYDGNTLSQAEYVLMYIITLIFLGAIIYFYKRNKTIAGLLVMMLILVAPVFSPKKITWFITERYLYYGSAFFTTLLAICILNFSKKLQWKYSSILLFSIIFTLYGYRTIARNNDWKNPETLGLATIKTSPLSVRPYNDIGGYYVLQGRYDDAKRYYKKALEQNDSLTAMRNLGYIYTLTDFDRTQTANDPQQSYSLAKQAMQSKDYNLAMYYFNHIYTIASDDEQVLQDIVLIYIEMNEFEKAEQKLQTWSKINPQNPQVFYLRGYMKFKEGNIPEAINLLNQVLELDPSHNEAQMNLQMLQQAQQ